MKALSLMVLVLAGASQAHASFMLEKEGDQVCRIQADQPKVCIPTLETTFLSQFKEVDLLKKISDFDVASRSAHEQRKLSASVVAGYSILSLRDLAISPKFEFEKDGYAYFPFFASVRWANRPAQFLNGTVFVEGYLRIPKTGDQTVIQFSNDPLEVQAVASELAEIKNYEDSQTDFKKPALRYIEKAARYLHFNIVGTDGLTVDGATQSLLKTVVAPMVYAEALDYFISNSFKKELEDRNFQEQLNGPKKLLEPAPLKTETKDLQLK